MVGFMTGCFFTFAMIEIMGGYPAEKCNGFGILFWMTLGAVSFVADMMYHFERSNERDRLRRYEEKEENERKESNVST